MRLDSHSLVQRLYRLWPHALALAAVLLVAILTLQNRALRRQLSVARSKLVLPHVGMVVPGFRGTSLTGESIAVAEPAPDERQVLLIFTTTCAFCMQALPTWQRIEQALSSDTSATARVIGISLDSLEQTREYVRVNSLRFPVLLLTDERTRAVYRMKAVPITMVLDGDGRVLHTRMGAPLGDQAVDSILAAARDGRSPEGPQSNARLSVGAPE